MAEIVVAKIRVASVSMTDPVGFSWSLVNKVLIWSSVVMLWNKRSMLVQAFKLGLWLDEIIPGGVAMVMRETSVVGLSWPLVGEVLGGCWVATEDMLVGFNSERREAAMRRREKTAISFADSQDSGDQLKISNTLLIVAPSFVITWKFGYLMPKMSLAISLF